MNGRKGGGNRLKKGHGDEKMQREDEQISKTLSKLLKSLSQFHGAMDLLEEFKKDGDMIRFTFQEDHFGCREKNRLENGKNRRTAKGD